MDRQNEQEERLTAFIESMKVTQTPFLMKLEKQALADGVPIIRPQTQALLRFLLEMKQPVQILEVGAAVGYSALFMREYAPAASSITTIEKDETRVEKARENFLAYEESLQAEGNSKVSQESLQAAGNSAADNILPSMPTLLVGDAADILRQLTGPYDFIFMDAAKGQYIHFLPEVKRLLAPGGVLLSDNILKEGEMLESKFAVTRRNRTIHKRMREYLDALTNDPELTTIVLSTGDGAAMSVKSTNMRQNRGL